MTTDAELRTEIAKAIMDAKSATEIGGIVGGLLDRLARAEAVVEAARDYEAHVQALGCDHDKSGAGTHTSCPPALVLDRALAAHAETDHEHRTYDGRVILAAHDTEAGSDE